jgi:hypothetical protein
MLIISSSNALWSGVWEMFRVNWNPRSRQDWFQILDSLNPGSKHFPWIFFVAQCWALWTIRNKFSIEGKFTCQHVDCIFKITPLQLWRPLQKLKDRALLDEMVVFTKAFFARTYSPPATSASYQSPDAS